LPLCRIFSAAACLFAIPIGGKKLRWQQQMRAR
jgi:hypothetical protein